MEKEDLHSRNRHRSRYDFTRLISACPALKKFVFTNEYNNETIDFADPSAVKILNKALLKVFYGVENWDIPEGYLCPPIPGRADYIHYMADLLGSCNMNVIPKGVRVSCLDIGSGANLVYPLIGNHEYGWNFVGSDIDDKALLSAKKILAANSKLKNIELRKQNSSSHIFEGIVKPGESFDLTFCNPPFHSSLAEAREGSTRKVKNLSSGKVRKVILNFGGQHAELWCKGGEKEFVTKMIRESAGLAENCLWFSSLVSKSANLPALIKELEKVNAVEVRTLEMKQGNKISRALAWTFLTANQQKQWRAQRFSSSPA